MTLLCNLNTAQAQNIVYTIGDSPDSDVKAVNVLQSSKTQDSLDLVLNKFQYLIPNDHFKVSP